MAEPLKISQSDIDLYRKAQIAFQQGQLLMQFATNHIAEVYRLGPQDTFDLSTGNINRARTPETAATAPAETLSIPEVLPQPE